MNILATKLISKFTLKIFKLAGIYIHVPFCRQACYYCDFHFSTNLSLISDFCDCLLNELSIQGGYLNGDPVETIYFGGGTPSLLDTKELDKILRKVYEIIPDEEAAKDDFLRIIDESGEDYLVVVK